MTRCPDCNADGYHYMTHVCPNCTCRHAEARIPGEPHIPAYLEVELNPRCPVHGDFIFAVKRTGGINYDLLRE